MSENLIREKRIISLNSNNATTYFNSTYLSDMSFDFLNILSPDDSVVFVEAGIGSAEIPCSFYNIETTNNVFNYKVNSINYSITVPIGNYNYSTLVTAMTTLFSANSHTMTFSLNKASNILTMTLTAGGTWNTIDVSSIYYVLGFNANTTYNIISNTITFPNLFNLLGQKKIKIYSNNISIDSYDSVNKSTSNLLSTISVSQPGFSMIVYQNVDGLYSRMRNHYLSTIDISIRDELNNLYNFNGVPWTLTINLILYRKIDVFMQSLKIEQNIVTEAPPQ